jgi:hypothetical protein
MARRESVDLPECWQTIAYHERRREWQARGQTALGYSHCPPRPLLYAAFSQLLKDPGVLFAGYKVPHPLEHYVLLRVRTKPSEWGQTTKKREARPML